ncbi:MAG: hypothetical protein A2792_00095 [Sphingomonadales bacterium RIFCSPHIGHO2_01_FULL_65_20]|nr:MAG: hypothetical protein A2792_00095 [Sphingomonadales bacterium RIFCSPHIGHO2_01_FULL_65_20]
MIKFRGYLIAAALAVCAVACTPLATNGGLPQAPEEIADATVLDEQVALSVELAYQATAIAAKAAADSGTLKGERAAQIATLDRRAFAAVQAVRKAYDAGNARSYGEAVAIARVEIAALLRLVT